MFKRDGSRAKSVFATIREEIPSVGEAERDLGSKIVIARNVMRMRIQRGYTQKQLAEAMGVRQPRIAEIEGARANLQIDTLDRLAKVFGIETANLLRVEKQHRLRRAAPLPTSVRSASGPTSENWLRRSYVAAEIPTSVGVLTSVSETYG